VSNLARVLTVLGKNAVAAVEGGRPPHTLRLVTHDDGSRSAPLSPGEDTP
jgi:hypothetical protein